jgi:N-acetylneuraminic acid mutarotase
VVKNVLYVIGGSNNGGGDLFNAVWAYNPKTKAWTSKAVMPTARCSAAATVENNIIYVIGGYASGVRLNTVEAYDPATDTWTEEAPLLVGKSEPAVATVGTTIVAADGYNGSGDNGDNEGYDVSTNVWTSLTADPSPRNAACFGSTKKGLLYVAGGADLGPALSVTESFKLSTKAWTTLAPMPQAVGIPGSAVYKNVLYCIGGASGGDIFQNTVYDYVQIYQP